MTEQAFIYDAVRTPRGRGRALGSLYTVKPVDLAAGVLAELPRRLPGLDLGVISDVVFGVVSPLGEQGQVVPKTAAMLASYPDTTGGVQVNRFCGSGLEAVNIAAQKVASGWDEMVVAGGVESMSRVPMGSDGGAWAMDPATSFATQFVPQGISADLLATVDGTTRDDVDAYAVRSQRRAASAAADGRFDRSLVPVVDRNGLVLLDHDEAIRADTTAAGLGSLRPSFAAAGRDAGFDAVALQKYHQIERIEHVHHAGNSSGIVDGAAAVLIGSESVGHRLGLTPRGRIAATATSGADPTLMLTGPVPATHKLLATAGVRIEDIDLFELNEAFAAVVLHYQRTLNIDDDKLNVNGGAIAMGHPLGATGPMLVGTVLDELERISGRYAVVTLCIGGGMGVATLIERL